MPLFKCPHCGKMVSSYANTCFYCGHNIHSSSKNKSSNDIKPHDSENANETKTFYSENKATQSSNTRQKCLNDSWVDFWKRKVRKNKIILFVLFLACLIGFIVSINSYVNGGLDDNYDDEMVFVFLYIIFGLLSFTFFSMFLISLFGCITRIKIRNYDGYTILVYGCILKNYLVIDNKILDSSLLGDSLYGSLPNKKDVVVKFAPFSGSITIEVH